MIVQAATNDYNTDACLILLAEGKSKNYTEFLYLISKLAVRYPLQLLRSGAIGRLLDFFIVSTNSYKGKKLR